MITKYAGYYFDTVAMKVKHGFLFNLALHNSFLKSRMVTAVCMCYTVPLLLSIIKDTIQLVSVKLENYLTLAKVLF